MKLDADTFKEIADSLLRNKSRSLLTGFGVFWGLFMLLFMVGGGDGLKALLGKNFEGFATNTCILFSNQTTIAYKGFKEGRKWNLELGDMDRLRASVAELDIVTPVVSAWGKTAVYDIHTIACNMKGVKADYAKIEEPKLKYGRYVSETDCALERKVCVIGRRIYEGLFPEGGNPCGKQIMINSIYYTVIGVDFSAGNMSIQGNADQAAIVPLPVLQKLNRYGKFVELIAMTGKGSTRMTELEGKIREVIYRQHDIAPQDKDAMGVINTEQLFQIIDNLFKGVSFLIWIVGLGTILAGAIGVSNIMMVTVKERTSEIGIRRAIGATPVQILAQILAESVCLTLAAGSAGIVFSVLLLEGMEKVICSQPQFSDVTFQIGFWTAVGAALLLAALGAIAGLAPALRAMGIKPVDAMRDE